MLDESLTAPRPPRSRKWIPAGSLNVVVQVELVRVRTHPHGIHFLGHLVINPKIDEVLGEHAALREEGMIFLEGLERFLKRSGDRRNVREFFLGKIKDVFVERTSGINLVFDA